MAPSPSTWNPRQKERLQTWRQDHGHVTSWRSLFTGNVENLNLKVSTFEFILLTETYVVNFHSVNPRRMIPFVAFPSTLEPT